MSTYLYSLIDKKLLAKCDTRYVYDCRQTSDEISAPIVAQEKYNYLCKYKDKTHYEYTDICIDGYAAYYGSIRPPNPFLIAKNGTIYEYGNFKIKAPVAIYSGDSREALLAYTAIFHMDVDEEKQDTSTAEVKKRNRSSKPGKANKLPLILTVTVILIVIAAIIIKLLS